MSRGPGRIQQTIIQMIESDADGAWTTGEICASAFRGANRIEKKHRVAVSRSLRTMALPETWAVVRCERSGSEYVLYNLISLESTLLKIYQSRYVSYCRSFEQFKGHYGHQIDKAKEDVAKNKAYFDADQLGRIKIRIAEEQKRLTLGKSFSLGAEFCKAAAENILKLNEMKAELEGGLNVSSAPTVQSGNTYGGAA